MLHARLSDRFGHRLKAVRLFGSAARYTASEHSDVDVAIIVEELTRLEWNLAIGETSEISLRFDVPLAPFVVSAAHFELLLSRGRSIARDILGEGISA